MDNSIHRRDFLKFFGSGVATLALTSCQNLPFLKSPSSKGQFQIPSINPNTNDTVTLADGLSYHRMISWMDPLSDSLSFGAHCDFTAAFLLPQKTHMKDEMILWVNNEYLNPYQLNSLLIERKVIKAKDQFRDKDFILNEQKQVGGSLVHFKRENKQWKVVLNSMYNRRLDGQTLIPFAQNVKILNQSEAVGTMANCAGGVTPWGTVLTCEENFQDYYGDIKVEANKDFKRVFVPPKKGYKWNEFFDRPPEHYGWVVEVDPYTGKAKKLTQLGRFAHEGATCVQTKQSVVVYMGDDKENEFFYKFVSKSANSIDQGTLYVAQIETGKWLSLDFKSDPIFKKSFKDQLDLNIRVREAARIVGATPLGRPEDCEKDPFNQGQIYLNLTSQKVNGKPFGVVLKIKEKDNNPNSLNFDAEEFIKGGPESGLAMPDNMIFDRRGNLWITTDIPDDEIGKGDFTSYGHNALFYIPMKGKQAGKAFRLMTAPKGAELTGPSFNNDTNEMYISVQHPAMDSQFPDGQGKTSRSSVISIHGPLMNQLLDI